jgi:hypothetical protein
MWVIAAWQSISPEVTVKCFKKCCVSSVMLWNGSEEDGYVRSECEEDEASDTNW